MARKKNNSEPRCVHRHTIKEHPSCFAKGRVKPAKLESGCVPQKEPWFKQDDYRIGYLDIETSNLWADFGIMLSWCLKEKEGEVSYDIISTKDIHNYGNDKRIVESLIEEMKRYAIICTYNGTRFDIPFVRTRALYHQMDFLNYGDIFHWDLYYTAKSKLRMTRKSLDAVTDLLGIPGKTPVPRETWRKAQYGHKESLQYVLDHNIADVVILEELHNKLLPFRKWIRSSI